MLHRHKDVTLSLKISNADEMRFSNDNVYWSSWKAIQSQCPHGRLKRREEPLFDGIRDSRNARFYIYKTTDTIAYFKEKKIYLPAKNAPPISGIRFSLSKQCGDHRALGYPMTAYHPPDSSEEYSRGGVRFKNAVFPVNRLPWVKDPSGSSTGSSILCSAAIPGVCSAAGCFLLLPMRVAIVVSASVRAALHTQGFGLYARGGAATVGRRRHPYDRGGNADRNVSGRTLVTQP